MKLSQAARAMEGRLQGPDREFSAVGTDTRTLAPGALFFALKGARHDGHAFLAEAARAGAAAAVVSSAGGPAPEGLPLVVVADTRRALGALAAHWRGRFAGRLVALTGSNGKTTVKEMLASILRAAAGEEAVHATRGNLNNEVGVPLTLLGLGAAHRYAVIEMGMNHAGELRYLARLAAPDVALVNNVGRAHLEFFESEEAIARAKGEIFEGLGPHGIAVVNADDRYAPLLRELAGARRRIEFALEHEAEVTATYRLRFLESEIAVRTPRGEARARLRAPGAHNVRNALAASAAAVALEIPVEAIAAGLERFPGIQGRMQLAAGVGGARLIDDTYNANPDSARAAIEVLARAEGRRVLVLGDMGELGAGAPGLHAEIGERARAAGIERLYALGELAAHAALAFGPGARSFARLEELLAALRPELGPQVTVLVKGSRFMRMERVVAALQARDEPAQETG